MANEEQSCSTCFIVPGFPGATISHGQCNFCAAGRTAEGSFAKETTSSVDDLKQEVAGLLDGYTGKYHCIIGCSGGIDSSYNLYVAKKVLGLNPLVLSYDHGFTKDLPKQNIVAMCEHLGVDYQFVKSRHAWDYRYVKHMVQALRPMDTYWGVCTFCHFVLPAAVYREVVRQKIPIAFVSRNHYERLPVPQRHKMAGVLKAFRQVSVSKYPGMVFHAVQAFACLAGLKAEFYAPPFSSVFRRESAPPKGLHFINTTKYFKWDIGQMVATLKEIGWQPPPGLALPMRFDCKIEEGLVNHTWKKHCAATVHEVICNNLIHEKVMTKQQLEQTVAHYTSTIDTRIREVFEILQIKP